MVSQQGGADLQHEGFLKLEEALPLGGRSLHHLHTATDLLQLQPLRYQLLPHPLWLRLQPATTLLPATKHKGS